jgi:superfamily I DNA/RNA helicase
VQRAVQLLARSIELANEGTIDFDDQLYMPVTFGGSWFENDRVLIDEAQDVSRIQAKMLRNILRDGGQLNSVGDPNQAIYGFRGAGSDSMEALKKLFKQTQMNLTYTFRCSKAVTAAAREIVPDIRCPDWAVEGSVIHRHDFNVEEIKSDGAVICRNMRPLVDLAFRLLSRGMKCYIAGRDIAQNLLTLIDSQHAEDIPDLELKLQEYLGAVTQRMTALGRPDRAESYADRVNVINACIASLKESTLAELKETIRSLFYNDSKGIRLGTIHGAKGLEWDTVYFLDADLIPSRYATLPWQIEQEMNLRYVAITRAHVDLVYIYSQGLR